jgi:hypothetical protein
MRRVTLVCGPSCAGKSTYVADHADPGDLILDQDEIGNAAMRRGLAQVAAMDTGTAWVIRCCPGPDQRAALAQQIRADEIVLLLPSEADLIARATHRPNPRRYIQAVRYWLDIEAGTTAPPVKRAATPAPRSRHRGGRPYRRARAHMFAMYGTVCIHCGHDGAGEADHLTPISVDPTQPIDPHLMRPSHGSNYPCPTCRRCCNQERGTKAVDSMFRPALDW